MSDGLFFDLPSLLSVIILLVALFHSDTLIFTELLQRRDLYDALKRPDLFELFGKIVRPMRAKKKEKIC